MADQLPLLGSSSASIVVGDTAATANTYSKRDGGGGLTIAGLTNAGQANSGGLSETTRAVTGTATLTTANRRITADATSGAFAITLPAASASIGTVYTIIKIDNSNNVTVTAAGSDTIIGAATKVLSSQWQAIEIWANTSSTWMLK